MSTADVYRALWRHRLFIAVLTGVLVGATWYLTSRQTPTYEASSLVRIQQRAEGDPGSAVNSLIASERLAQTYAEMIKNGAIDARVAVKLADAGSSAQLGDVELSAKPVESLDLLWVRGISPDPELALQVANAAPSALREFIRETGTLHDRIVNVKRATLPAEPASPDLLWNLAIALLLGLLLNAALALLIEMLSDRLPETDELESLVELPVLGTIPSLPFAKRGSRRDRESDARPPIESADGHRAAAANRERTKVG